MVKQPNKPATYTAFEDLTRKLLAVPKADLTREVEAKKAKQKRPKRGRKKS